VILQSDQLPVKVHVVVIYLETADRTERFQFPDPIRKALRKLVRGDAASVFQKERAKHPGDVGIFTGNIVINLSGVNDTGWKIFKQRKTGAYLRFIGMFHSKFRPFGNISDLRI
jgi:hypothetical protein